jgi:hypothetical protein
MPVFETSIDDVLGLWQKENHAEVVSFGVDPDSEPLSGPTYRVNLPADQAEAEHIFDGSDAAFERIETALREVPSRLDGLVERTRENQPKPGTSVSFDVLDKNQEAGPEADLLAQIADVERSASEKGAAGDVSFGISETVSENWNAARRQFESLISQIDRDVLHFAWVETTISGQLIARTSVDWSGDAQTAWINGSTNEQLGLHQRNLRFATQTRGMRLRLFVTVASGAARLASLMATPGGAVLALPAVYQYVTIILAQARELQSVQNQ